MRVWFVLAVLLAGCSGAAKDAPQEDVQEQDLPDGPDYEPLYKSRTGGFVNGTDAAYFCDTIANSTVQIDVNRTLDGGAHSHDMWNGQDSLVIFEGRIEDFVTLVQNGDTAVGTAATWFATPGAVVHPGAGRATFKLEWDTSAVDDRELGVDLPILQRQSVDRHADYVLKFTQSGQEHDIDFTFEDNDPAHAEKTLWRFKINHGNAVTDAGGRDDLKDLAYQTVFPLRDAKLTWTIHRVYDCLPVDPPHYSFWNGTTHMVVFEESIEHDAARTPVTGQGTFGGWQRRCGGFECGLPDNGTIPPGTGTVVVTLKWDNEEAVPTKLGLEYVAADQDHSSTQAVWARPPPAEDRADERVWILDVHPLQTDSPYAEISRWDFRWYFDDLFVDDVEDVGKFRGTIDWKVEAFRAGYGP